MVMAHPIRKQFAVLAGLVLLFCLGEGIYHRSIIDSVVVGAGLIALLDSAFDHPLSRRKKQDEGNLNPDRDEALMRVNRSSPEVKEQ